MDVENLIGTMIQGTLAGGGKRSYGAGRYLRGGRGSFLNASTLLTVGGLVWGVIETMQQQSAGEASAPVPAASGASVPQAPTLAVPPPLPTSVAQPAQAPATTPSASSSVPEGAAKLVRLMVAAARADGALTETEQDTILEHARAAGAEALVQEELARPTSLPRIVEGIGDAQQRSDLYTLAYGIVRADESVTGSEQIFLAQLAALLELDSQAVARLEGEAASKIDAAGQAGA